MAGRGEEMKLRWMRRLYAAVTSQLRLRRIGPCAKRFHATAAAQHERWNLRDIVLVSSHAGLVSAADTNNL